MAADTAELRTLRDFLRHAVSRFNAAGLAYGHGTDNAFDEAAFLLLEALNLPIDRLEPFLEAALTAAERERLAELIEARVATRKPAAYLLGRAYIRGVPFRVDERVIVPRSFIGEILTGELGEALLAGRTITKVLDLCTGSGCLAILAARAFPEAEIHASDLSAAALEVARRNVGESGHAGRIRLFEGDLFAPLTGERYDLILANPPYVSDAAMAALPAEYRHEPRIALAGGADGLALVRRILAEAPRHMTAEGGLICEIGSGRKLLESAFPRLPFTWLDTAASAGEVFWIASADFAGKRPTPPPPRTRPRAVAARRRRSGRR